MTSVVAMKNKPMPLYFIIEDVPLLVVVIVKLVLLVLDKIQDYLLRQCNGAPGSRWGRVLGCDGGYA